MFNYKECAFLEGNITWKQVSNQETVEGPIGGPGGGLQPGVLPRGGGLQPGVFGGGPITGMEVGQGRIGVRPRVWPGGSRVRPWGGVFGSGGRPGLDHFTGGQGGGRIFGYATEMEYYGNPDMPLSSVILSNSLSQPICTSQTSRSTKLPEFVVALNDIYLLNYIIFDPYHAGHQHACTNPSYLFDLHI